MIPLTELIEKFLRGRLSPEEKKLLAQKRKQPDFEEALQNYQQVMKAVQYQGESEMKARLQQFEQNLQPATSPGLQIRQLIRWSISVAAIFALSLFTFFFWPKAQENSNYLSEYFQPALNTYQPAVRGNMDMSGSTTLSQALQAYDLQQYPEAITLFDNLVETSSTSLFYQANALLANDQSEMAIPILETLIQQNNDYTYQSRWYLALAYLDGKAPLNARSLLQELAQQPGSKQKIAEQILGSL